MASIGRLSQQVTWLNLDQTSNGTYKGESESDIPQLQPVTALHLSAKAQLLSTGLCWIAVRTKSNATIAKSQRTSKPWSSGEISISSSVGSIQLHFSITNLNDSTSPDFKPVLADLIKDLKTLTSTHRILHAFYAKHGCICDVLRKLEQIMLCLRNSALRDMHQAGIYSGFSTISTGSITDLYPEYSTTTFHSSLVFSMLWIQNGAGMD